MKYYYKNPDEADGLWKRYIQQDIFSAVNAIAASFCGVDWSSRFVHYLRLYSDLSWEDMAEQPERYKSKKLDDVFAYIMFVQDKMASMFGEHSEWHSLIQKVGDEQYKTGQYNPDALKEPYKAVKQFTEILKNLIYETGSSPTAATKASEDPNVKKMEKDIESLTGGVGHEENVATLCSGLNEIDTMILTNVLIVMNTYAKTDADPTFKLVLNILRQAVKLAKL